jgi:ketosteroid isomerase-like protein
VQLPQDAAQDLTVIPPGLAAPAVGGGSSGRTRVKVTAGADVAFAHALLRCGTDEELKKDPDNRLRLTIGLRKEGGRWAVSHEHHSFPDKVRS